MRGDERARVGGWGVPRASRADPSRSPSWWATRSAMLRVLTNTSVVRCPLTCSAIRSRICAICSPVGTAPSSSSGISSARSSCLRCPESTIAHRGVPSGWSRSSPAPTSRRAIAEIGRTVADSPTRCTGPSATCASRSRVRARCEPRLFAATEWISSTITVRVARSMARLRSAVTSRNSDSGVVIRMSGGFLSIAARSAAAVSPVRTATRIRGAASPRSPATAAISRSGASRFCWMSVASAFSGDTYTTCGPACASPAR